jgi:hypothetical protein
MEEHQRHVWVGEPDADLIRALEPDQLVTAVHRPVPRLKLSTRVEVGLWILRVFLLIATAAVVYAFVVGIVKGGS